MSTTRGHHHRVRPPGGKRRGTILIVTMWVVLVLAGLVLVLARAMRAEIVSSGNELSRTQAGLVEQGAIQYVLSCVDSLEGQTPDEAETPCEAVRLGQGAFWIIRPDYEDDRAYAYGIVDEASKINLNYLVDEASKVKRIDTSKLADMTDELAAGITDWCDGDEDITPGGAESEYYLLLSDPYQCKSAPLETVEELLLVKGATKEILYGEDVNRNGVLDTNEDDGDVADPPDNRDGQLDRGLAAFATVYSVERNRASDGQDRINVTQASNRGALVTLLRSVISSPERVAAISGRILRGRPFSNVLDFADKAGLTVQEFRPIADRLTSDAAGTLRGLVNVNTAPKEVLACLPDLDDSDVAALLARRAGADADLSNLAWVFEALPHPKASAIGGSITTRTYRFSADIVSVSADGRAFRRCRITVDAQSSPPRVIHYQDLTHLGWPLAPGILAALRAGASLDDIATGQTVAREASL